MAAPETLAPADLAALSIFPLPASALYPGTLLPLRVFEPRYRELVRDAMAGSRVLAIARLKPGYEDRYDGRPPVFDVCGAGRIIEHTLRPEGDIHILLYGLGRVRIVRELPPAQPYRVVRAERIDDLPADADTSAELQANIASLWELIAPQLPDNVRELADVTRGATDAGTFADKLAGLIVGDPDTSQSFMSEPDPCERLRVLLGRIQRAADAWILRAGADKSSLN